MKSIIKFFKESFKSIFLNEEGGLSLPKLFLLVTSCAATYKFIIAEVNDPWIWLVYLGVVGGHGLASKLLEVYIKKRAEKNIAEIPDPEDQA